MRAGAQCSALICKHRIRRINERRKRSEMQRILLFALLFAQAASCNAASEWHLKILLEDVSLLLHNLSRQYLLWQCNTTHAPSNAHRLASCQQATHGKAEPVLLRLPTIESLAKVLSQLTPPNALYDDFLTATHQRRSKRQNEECSLEDRNAAERRFNVIHGMLKNIEMSCAESSDDIVNLKIEFCNLT